MRLPGRKTLTATALAAALSTSVLTAAPAHAQVIGPNGCYNTDDVYLEKQGGCNAWWWDGSGNNTLYVNDWYYAVYTGAYCPVVTWRDIVNNNNIIDSNIGPHSYSWQPNSNSYLVTVQFKHC